MPRATLWPSTLCLLPVPAWVETDRCDLKVIERHLPIEFVDLGASLEPIQAVLGFVIFTFYLVTQRMKFSVARGVVFELSATQHRSQKMPAVDDFLRERLVAERVARHRIFRGVHVFSRFDQIVVPSFHIVKLSRKQCHSILV